ncbi:hypothetical protein KORDIASMS9_01992 [Kordia sp. SMS9]|uniref:hypothetical protein n=1 Tax=Kordia sp. SMS9 TaxID=2282170 RepID=UPI000E0D1D30|nr:hypothetical protein [Kordia sp. SMS9]AXG69765.1 hypothetical protein KORDIASMS9_01992 [Kordia sp. SMS9]
MSNIFNFLNQENEEEQQNIGFDNLETLQDLTTKTARSISNEIAMNSPFGKGSVFYRLEYVYKNIDFKGIRGLWNAASDNTFRFNKAISEGLTNEKAAFETWTGERAIEQGFKKVKIDVLIPDVNPYTKINVTFYK